MYDRDTETNHVMVSKMNGEEWLEMLRTKLREDILMR